ncbi:MAG: hypothetical protein JSU94_05265 [Phycisphaerales bacterium]|nr:MAG: hypothetical protein JSU94_05265 [Phycisphaerales bacterium]
MKRFSLFVMFLVLGLSGALLAWSPVNTHGLITHDALDFLDAGEFPDLKTFEDELIVGSNTEAHSPPGVPPGETRWEPIKEDWFSKRDCPYGKQCALEYYEELYFSQAYTRIGYIMHNTADEHVPAHMARVIHGPGIHTDEMEFLAEFSYGLLPGMSDWLFTDNQGHTWSYWLYDSGDDDRPDPPDDIPDSGDTYPDDNGLSEPYWGIPVYAFGSYGYGVWPTDKIPGNSLGQDYFWNQPDYVLLQQCLGAAWGSTIIELASRSMRLPPVVASPIVPGNWFGPKRPITMKITVRENRKPDVYLRITVAGAAIRDVYGNNMDGGPSSHKVLTRVYFSNSLPYKKQLEIRWDGTMAAGGYHADGIYAIKFEAKDIDGNWSNWKAGIIKYDKTPPTATNLRK